MTNVSIAKLRRRYRLPADALNERARIDRVFNAALADDLFDAALERAGIVASDEVCIRRVESVVRLSAGADEAKLAVGCSVALAEAIAAELTNGGANIVRFGSRRQALVDMSLSVARGNLERAWAWHRVDLWRTDILDSLREAEREVLMALARYPLDATHVLVMLSDANLLPTYVTNVPESYWSALARAILAESNGVPEQWGLSGLSGALFDGQVGEEVEETWQMTGIRRAHDWSAATSLRVRRTSRVLRTVIASGTQLSPMLAQAFAAIATVECEPAIVGTPRGAGIMRAIARSVIDEQLGRTPSTPKSEGAHRTIGDEPADSRVYLHTQFGGLLFLLHAVRALDLPALMATRSEFSPRSIRWLLHELAVLLLKQALGDKHGPDELHVDASSYIFAGIVAGKTRDGSLHGAHAVDELANEPFATLDELAALHEIADDIALLVRQRGGALEDESNAAMLCRIIQRPAEIVVDAAWIETRFSVNDTSTDIRRAGLDFDLGWLPWLGIVVRFAYA